MIPVPVIVAFRANPQYQNTPGDSDITWGLTATISRRALTRTWLMNAVSRTILSNGILCGDKKSEAQKFHDVNEIQGPVLRA
jgi:hypothetical protein